MDQQTKINGTQDGAFPERKPRKTYIFRDLNSPVELLTTENITYTPRTEMQSIKGEIIKFNTKVSSFKTYDQDILDMPAFNFENKTIDWKYFAKDLSILSPGYPRNRYLLKQFIKRTGAQSNSRDQEESIVESNQRSAKKKKYTEEELIEKKRSEKPYSYEYYVEGRHIVKDAKALRDQQITSAMIKKSRINYYQQLKKRETVDEIVEQNEFIHHINFLPDTSLPWDAESKDPFDIFNNEGYEEEPSKKGGSKSIASDTEKTQERVSLERVNPHHHHHHYSRNDMKFAKNNKDRNPSRQGNEKPEKDTTTNVPEPHMSKTVRRKSDSSLWSGGISRLEVKTQNIYVDLLAILRGRKEKKSQKLLRIEIPGQEQLGLLDPSPLSKKKENDKHSQKRRNSVAVKYESMRSSNLHRKNASIHQNTVKLLKLGFLILGAFLEKFFSPSHQVLGWASLTF